MQETIKIRNDRKRGVSVRVSQTDTGQAVVEIGDTKDSYADGEFFIAPQSEQVINAELSHLYIPKDTTAQDTEETA